MSVACAMTGGRGKKDPQSEEEEERPASTLAIFVDTPRGGGGGRCFWRLSSSFGFGIWFYVWESSFAKTKEEESEVF